ncbi:MAG: hypothetical protein LAP21_21395 [Acidobacteriia bacterium]|nr:hypothetical protein [Terriglobia bacterium]
MKPPLKDRWASYVQLSGDSLGTFLQEHLGTQDRNKTSCLIVGKGFDPRMLSGATALSQVLDPKQLAIIMLVFDEGATSPSRKYDDLVQKNVDTLTKMVPAGKIQERKVAMFSPEGRRITSRSAEAVFRSVDEFRGFSDIFVDVSSLPRSVYFPAVAKLLHLLDGVRDGAVPNLFVMVSENAELDRRVIEEGIDEDADYIHPFRGAVERESAAGRPKVWFPLLGENQGVQLTRIYDLINPAEICPLLPSPSMDPRRGDNLVVEYRELLFDQLRVETRNFIHACETNPFEAYRQLRRAILHYAEALEPLGGSNAVISANSSKLLSVGALLAAYELKRDGAAIAIAHVEAHGYVLKDSGDDLDRLASESRLQCLWLSGSCYA